MPVRTLLAALVSTVLALTLASPAEAATYRLQPMEMPDGSKVAARWDPCEVISFRVSVRGVKGSRAKQKAVRVAKRSVHRLGEVAGLDFDYQGKTRMVPRRDNTGSQPADLVIGFARPRQTDWPISGPTAGYGGWRGTYARTQDGSWAMEITTAFVVVDHPQTRRWPNRLARRGVTRPNLITHELGHAVGLGHVEDRREIMNDVLHHESPAGFGAGDRMGLQRVGGPAGCID